MTQLTPHFKLEEFQKNDPIPEECIPIFTELCEKILEPVHDEFNAEMDVESGHRSERANTEAHGQPNSDHLSTTFRCACDFKMKGIGQRFVFDWMRNNPNLPFHQLILEHGKDGSSIIHVSINKMMPGIRSVLEGSEHNESKYIKIDHVAFQPKQSQQISG